MIRSRLVIMLKEPVAGRVKTRLGRDIGMTNAAWWFRHQSNNLIRRLQSPRWETWLAVAPDGALHRNCWPLHLPRMPQGSGDLGVRMARILNSSIGPVVLVGSDIPDIQPRHIRDAFALLGRHDLVFGPADDGGFWLAGARKPTPFGLFHDVPWSEPSTMSETLKTTKHATVGLVSQLSDVDCLQDLQNRKSKG